MSEADRLFEELGYKKLSGVTTEVFTLSKANKNIAFSKLINRIRIYGKYDFIDMQELQAINMKVEELRMDIAETKRNIEYWENEVQQALKENDIMKAVGCRILANNLRKDIGESEI